jgi:predicted RNA-binding protein with PIN domain
MTNKIIIDGWNVCWKISEISDLIPDDLESARAKLSHIINMRYGAKKVIIKIFYDGQSGIHTERENNSKIEIKYSKNPQKADHLIIDFLKREKNRKQWTVITSDRDLGDKIKNLGAQVIKSEMFIKKLSLQKDHSSIENNKINPRVDQNEINFWLRKFQSK